MLLKRTPFLDSALLFLLLTCFTSLLYASPTVMKTGKWISQSSIFLAQAEIDGRREVICLPRLDFIGEIDHEKLSRDIDARIKSQEAVFHVYHDGIGRFKRVGGMIFISDVFLKDLKMTYTGYLRKLGYRFTISKVPVFDDPDYMREVQIKMYLATPPPIHEQSEEVQTPTGDSGGSLMPVGAVSFSAGSGALPSRVLPRTIRENADEVREKIREIKSNEFRAELIMVDPVRWAGGVMGTVKLDGTIEDSVIEGRKLPMMIPVPAEKNWLKDAMVRQISGQPVEFILRRDLNGREVTKDKKLVLADIYFIDLGLTWEDWLGSHKLDAPAIVPDPSWATAPLKLETVVVKGVWDSLRTPVIAQIKVNPPTLGLKAEEFIRITPFPERPRDFRLFQQRVNEQATGQFIDISLLVCPDGMPYSELGQKRAHRIYFPQKRMTLFGVMDNAAK